MTRLPWVLAGAAAALVLAAGGWGMFHPAAGSADRVIGRPAPALAIAAFDGSRVDLAALRGRPVVVNFWASWCAPCRQEDPALQEASRRLAGSVAFVGVDFQDSLEAARAYESGSRHVYPVGQPVSGSPADFGVTGPPETFFIDAQGRVAARFVGPLDGPSLARYLGLLGVGT